jgi:hypothetical protein
VIVCTKCGFQNEAGDAFCGSCGSFLEWAGDAPPAAAGTPTPTVTEPAVEDAAAAQAQRAAEDAARAEEQARAAAEQAERVRREADERARRESEDRARADEAARAAAAEEARRQADESERARQEAQARAAAEEEARRQADEAERAHQDAEARAAAEEEARRQAEEAARNAALEDRQRAEEEARRRAEEAERLRKEATDRARAEEEARARAEAEARARAEADETARREAAERAQAEEEARRLAEEAARERAEAEAAAKAEADRRLQEENLAKQKAEEEATKADAAAKRAAALVAKTPAPPPKLPEKAPVTAVAPTGAGPLVELEPEEDATGRQPDAVKPGMARVRPQVPTTKQPPSRQIRPGDLICGECGEGNDPARKFCRRCGTSLVEAVVVPIPWYKRIFRRKPAVAGTRPGKKGAVQTGRRVRRGFRGAVSRVFAIIGLLGLSALAIGYIGPWRDSVNDTINDAYKAVRRVIAPTYDPIATTDPSVTSAMPGHEPQFVVDGITNTYWAADAAVEQAQHPQPIEASEGATLVFTFAEAVDFDEIWFRIGASEKPEEYKLQPRPRAVHITLHPGAIGHDLTLSDNGGDLQRKKLKARGVTQVEIQVTELFPALESGGKNVAIAEIEFAIKGPR